MAHIRGFGWVLDCCADLGLPKMEGVPRCARLFVVAHTFPAGNSLTEVLGIVLEEENVFHGANRR